MLPSEGDLTAANFSTYAPVRISCPNRDQWIRSAGSLSDEETEWVAGRKKKVRHGLTSYLERLKLRDFDLRTYLKRLQENHDNIPIIGMTISGGGWASSLTGTGVLRGLDARFPDSVQQRTGGILQSMTYLSGLSGGSWPGISLATYNFPKIDSMVHAWRVNVTRTAATNDTRYAVTAKTLIEEIYPKFKAGYNVSFADWLGRAVSYEFVAGPNGGLASMISDITTISNFQDHNMPMPIWQAAQGTSDDIKFYNISAPYYNATLFEWNPFEFGAWNGPSSFFPIKYLGTKMVDGVPAHDECLVGFDRVSFMLGAAADAVNFWFVDDLSNNTLGPFGKRDAPQQEGDVSAVKARGVSQPDFPLSVLEELAQAFQEAFNYTLDEALYLTLPNPFASNNSVDNNSNPPANLTLLDESEMGQSLPLWSQIQPARSLDFIIAWDDDEDAHPYNWNNGTNIFNSYLYAKDNDIPFPIIPNVTTFINRNFTSKPTFFGCNPNLTTTQDTQAPIILSLLNAPYSTFTNYSWLQTNFSDENMAAIMTNSFNYITQGNTTLDSEWPECLGCAAVERSLARVGLNRTDQCNQCFAKYCWDGVEDNSTTGLVDIPLVLDPGLTYAVWNQSSPITGPYWDEVSK